MYARFYRCFQKTMTRGFYLFPTQNPFVSKLFWETNREKHCKSHSSVNILLNANISKFSYCSMRQVFWVDGVSKRMPWFRKRVFHTPHVFVGPMNPGTESKDYSPHQHCRNLNLTAESPQISTRRPQPPDEAIVTLCAICVTHKVLKKSTVGIFYCLSLLSQLTNSL